MLARRTAKDSTQIHYKQITQGAFVYGVYYTALLYAAYAIGGPRVMLAFALTLPVTGIFARAYTRFVVRRERVMRFAFFQLTHRYYAERIKQQRQAVIAEIDRVLDVYLAARADDESDAGTTSSPAERRDASDDNAPQT